MVEFHGRLFQDQRIEIDGGRFSDCIFVRCELVYAAKDEVALIRNDIHDCRWVFEDAAGATLRFLVQLSNERGGAALIQGTFPQLCAAGANLLG
jgi:hypothetical protein